jgi:hypothetical protein
MIRLLVTVSVVAALAAWWIAPAPPRRRFDGRQFIKDMLG